MKPFDIAKCIIETIYTVKEHGLCVFADTYESVYVYYWCNFKSYRGNNTRMEVHFKNTNYTER